MLKKVPSSKIQATQGKFAIVASRYNARYVDAMLRSAKIILNQARVGRVEVVRVPGAYEIPVVVARLARSRTPPLSAILCLGVIFRGQTVHAQLIAESVSHMLAVIQVETEVPVIHGVLLFENQEQAKERCLSKEHNRGAEAALTGLEMARVMAQLG